MRSALAATLIWTGLAAISCFPQTNESHTAPPRIIIKLPEKLPSDTVWIRYLLNHHGSAGERMHLEGNGREYMIVGAPNISAQPAKIVLYSPGCEFKTYELDLHPGSDVEERFQCDPLPTKTLRGFIAPGEIPHAIYYALERRLNIVGTLDNDWTCTYFLQPPPGSNGPMSGSCLSGLGPPLGSLGTLDPADGGKFEITIPDFTRDPIYKRDAAFRSHFGIIAVSLRDKSIDEFVGLIKPENDSLERYGLRIQAEYPDPITFTRAH